MAALFIFRRDLRLHDNMALAAAAREHKAVHLAFILTPEQTGRGNRYRSMRAIEFMLDALGRLPNLAVYYGRPAAVLQEILRVSAGRIAAVYVNADYTAYSTARDAAIEKVCSRAGVAFKSYHDALLVPPGMLRRYVVLTPFLAACRAHLPTKRPSPASKIRTRPAPHCRYSTTLAQFRAKMGLAAVSQNDESAVPDLRALSREQRDYEHHRDLLRCRTTRLSAHIKFGTVSIREVFWAFRSNEAVVRQLVWRDFYYRLGMHAWLPTRAASARPNTPRASSWADAHTTPIGAPILQPKNDKWAAAKDRGPHLKAWQEGRTGFPVVDACMRELNETGYMHNRGRLIVADFLIKMLGIDWREGERYFSTKLIDYDPLVNNGNWQWVAGTGADRQPYPRMFNPWLQGARFDKDCVYIKHWLPELRSVAPQDIHNPAAPWRREVQAYPPPIVDYAGARAAFVRRAKFE